MGECLIFREEKDGFGLEGIDEVVFFHTKIVKFLDFRFILSLVLC